MGWPPREKDPATGDAKGKGSVPSAEGDPLLESYLKLKNAKSDSDARPPPVPQWQSEIPPPVPMGTHQLGSHHSASSSGPARTPRPPSGPPPPSLRKRMPPPSTEQTQPAEKKLRTGTTKNTPRDHLEALAAQGDKFNAFKKRSAPTTQSGAERPRPRPSRAPG